MSIYDKPATWAKEMQTFAGRKLKGKLAATILGLPMNTYYKRNQPIDKDIARPPTGSERALMALLREVITPAQQEAALHVILREVAESGLAVDETFLQETEKTY